jgi:hypothetical protein
MIKLKTKNKTYTLAIIGAVMVVGAISYIAYRRNSNKKIIGEINDILDGTATDPNNKPQGGEIILSQTDYNSLPAGSFPLKIGDKNKKVYDMQKNLKANYGSNLDLDGKFGVGTYSVICDKYFTIPCVKGYYRNISQTNFDEIKNHKP